MEQKFVLQLSLEFRSIDSQEHKRVQKKIRQFCELFDLSYLEEIVSYTRPEIADQLTTGKKMKIAEHKIEKEDAPFDIAYRWSRAARLFAELHQLELSVHLIHS
jgi:hypothetical protein